MKPGDTWIRKSIPWEERIESGLTGWACVFILLDEGRMLTITEEGDWRIHKDASKFAFWELEKL